MHNQYKIFATKANAKARPMMLTAWTEEPPVEWEEHVDQFYNTEIELIDSNPF